MSIIYPPGAITRGGCVNLSQTSLSALLQGSELVGPSGSGLASYPGFFAGEEPGYEAISGLQDKLWIMGLYHKIIS